MCISLGRLHQAVCAASMGVKVQVESIIKSEEDQRQYRALVLNNDLKVLLISDPATDKSAAALDVHVGEWLCSLLLQLLWSRITYNAFAWWMVMAASSLWH